MSGNVPELRFAGFTEPWEQRKLGELTSILSAARVHKDEWKSEGVPFFRSSDVMAAFNGADNEKAFISYELFEKLSAQTGAPEQGDVLVTGGGSVGTPYIVPDNEPLYTKDADLIWIKRSPSIDSEFLYYFFVSPSFRDYIGSISHVGTIAHYTIEQVKATPLCSPSKIEEQCQIGALFARLDSLITLHRRKHDKLVQLKSSLLSKMFPEPGHDAPELRFSGFTEPWEQRKFSDVFTFLGNNTLSRSELSNSEGASLDVHYGDVLIKYSEVLDAGKDQIPCIASDEKAASLSCPPLQDGDVIMADTAEDEAVGKCSELRNVEDRAVFSGLHTMPCRPNDVFAPGYLGFYLNSDAYHTQLLPLMQGIKVISVSRSAISDTTVRYPSLPEQEAIGGLFSRLDSLITLHQRKHDKLVQLKSSLLDKMFV